LDHDLVSVIKPAVALVPGPLILRLQSDQVLALGNFLVVTLVFLALVPLIQLETALALVDFLARSLARVMVPSKLGTILAPVVSLAEVYFLLVMTTATFCLNVVLAVD
jgi:hypothetical protein